MIKTGTESIVEGRAKNRGHKMGEVGGAFIELQETYHAMIGEILGDARFSDTEMLGKAGFNGLGTAACGGTAQKAADSDAQGLARLDEIVRGKVGVAEKQDSWTDRGAIRLTEL